MSALRVARRQGRWIAVAGAALLLAVGAIALGVVLIVGGSGGPTHGDFVSRVNALLAPVANGDRELASALSAVQRPDDLPPVRAAASRNATAISRAQVTASVLRAPARDEPTLRLLERALRDDLAAAQRLGAAAVRLTPARATAAATAADDARRSWVALGAADGKLTVPSGDAATGLEALARRTAPPTDRRWVSAIDALLLGSAGDDGATAALVDDVELDRGHDPTAATRRIDGIVARRLRLQSRIAALTPPARFRPAALLLRASVASSVADALATQRFVRSWYLSDATSYNSQFAHHHDAMSRAAGQEAAFLRRYNALRARVLHLKPLGVSGY